MTPVQNEGPVLKIEADRRASATNISLKRMIKDELERARTKQNTETEHTREEEEQKLQHN